MKHLRRFLLAWLILSLVCFAGFSAARTKVAARVAGLESGATVRFRGVCLSLTHLIRIEVEVVGASNIQFAQWRLYPFGEFSCRCELWCGGLVSNRTSSNAQLWSTPNSATLTAPGPGFSPAADPRLVRGAVSLRIDEKQKQPLHSQGPLEKERGGFEPPKRLPVYAISSRVPSATRTPLREKGPMVGRKPGRLGVWRIFSREGADPGPVRPWGSRNGSRTSRGRGHPNSGGRR